MKTFPIKIDDELHKMIKHAAIEDDISVQSWIVDAINKKLQVMNTIIKDKTNSYGDSTKPAGRKSK
jgi:enamine deaminase RidA (YjgF/YER057c/UK114 family)